MILPVAATPFTVLVKVFTAEPRVLELIIGTVAPATPFTVVEMVLAAEVLATVLTIGEVAATPLTVEVRVLTADPRVLVVAPVRRAAGLIQVPSPW